MKTARFSGRYAGLHKQSGARPQHWKDELTEVLELTSVPLVNAPVDGGMLAVYDFNLRS